MSLGMQRFRERHIHLTDRVSEATADSEELAPWKARCLDPEALLDRWIRGLNLQADAAVAVSGVGDGSHLRKLLEILPEGGMVFCAEANARRFNAFLATDLAAELMTDRRLLFGVGEIDDMFFRTLASFEIVSYASAEPLIFAPLYQEDEAFYARFFLEFARNVEMWRKMYGTNLSQSGFWQRNTFLNLRRLIVSPDPIEFQGCFEGLPLIMAGAGPSLDESLEFIKSMQDRAVVVAGNSSFRALRRAGVDPHFVLAADPNPSTDLGFHGAEIGRSLLLCPFMVYPEVPKRFGDRISAWSFGNPVASYLRKQSGRDREAFVTEQGTVSACAFDLAVILGCRTVFFAGQDLAARSDGQMHASDSFYADQGSDRTTLEGCRWLPGNTLEKVPVEAKLFVYLKTFVELARAYSKELKLNDGKGLTLYNISRLGAKVEGMPYLSLREASEVMQRFPAGGSEKAWKQVEAILLRHRVGWGKIGRTLSELQDYVSRTLELSLEAAMAIELEKIDLETAKQRKRSLEEATTAREDFLKILMEGQLKRELHIHERAKALMTRLGAGSELEQLGSYFWAVAEGAFHLASSIEMSRQDSLAAQ
ncbi:6-hydroxymethylpterin diphosphokinase MptE-like protein [Pelagicoccus sp. SDUM812003]|uniref:motility associated factor glycosyltransferase family protein n=1 Tax=Pelagicoccus sp. SDUM812003 TaxID=3041267 RepID=UPI00281094BE|nr:6-hydroxymethylpterin diphosphokinase MptE-like protein [Pelagicoccus sp. SDUM812003]MDQ8201534.1 DUF115 domain-containing protein [Pelagicoccus sp. SDUM812003]